MAITEDFFSREQHETTEGITVRLAFTCTWDDWSNGTDGIIDLPIIGDKLTDYLTGWPVAYDELVCTDRKAITENNDYARVLCFYSTESAVARQRRPGQAKSWKFDLLTDSYVEETDGFAGAKQAGIEGGNWFSWAKIWNEQKPTGAPDDPLPLKILKTGLTLRITIYSSYWLMPGLIELLGTINETEFLKPALVSFVSDDNFEVVWANWDNLQNTEVGTKHLYDIHQWLFLDVQSERVNKNSFEYKLDFKHAGFDPQNKRSNWDVSHGIGDINLYPTTNFIYILNQVANLDADLSGGG